MSLPRSPSKPAPSLLEVDGEFALSALTGSKPAYRALADQIRAAVLSKQLPDGQRLPTEIELSRRYSVSRQTVRRAYLDLVMEGVVERIPGRGTFPAPPNQYLRSFGSIDELLALSEDTELEIVHPLADVVDAEVATKLGMQFENVRRVVFRRLHREMPFCLTQVFLPPLIAKQLGDAPWLITRGARSRATVLSLLDRIPSISPVGAKQVITSVGAHEDVGPPIDCSVGQPIMRIERLHFNNEGRPVELCVNYFNPDRYTYRLQLQRHRSL